MGKETLAQVLLSEFYKKLAEHRFVKYLRATSSDLKLP